MSARVSPGSTTILAVSRRIRFWRRDGKQLGNAGLFPCLSYRDCAGQGIRPFQGTKVPVSHGRVGFGGAQLVPVASSGSSSFAAWTGRFLDGTESASEIS